MELVSTIEINGEEREIADAYARGQIATNAQNIATNAEGIAGLNNNLTQLEFSEIAGGKNLFNPKCLLNATYDEKTDTITVSANTRKALDMVFKENTQYTFSAYITQLNEETYIRFSIIYTDGTINNYFLFSADLTEKYYSQTTAKGKTISEVKWYFNTNGKAKFRNFQIEEGTQATPYEPYIPSVAMLADEVSAQNESLSVVGKCKNLLNPSHLGTTVMGITCTNNGDGTYALNGTATADLDLCIKGFKNLQLNKEYKMLGCPSGGSDSTYMLYDSSESDIKDIGKGKVYTPTKQPNINIRIMNGVTVNNLVFKPMLTTNLSATYDDFVPYTGDGETLTADVAELKNDLSDSLPVGTILTVVDSATMSSDMWKLLKTGTLSYQDGGALVEISTITYQKIK